MGTQISTCGVLLGLEVLAAILGQVMAGEAEPGPRTGPDPVASDDRSELEGLEKPFSGGAPEGRGRQRLWGSRPPPLCSKLPFSPSVEIFSSIIHDF